jgi:predicted  nucleic acid-binding Zn ribbon protein
MLLCEYSFKPREDVDIEVLEDEVQGLLGSLSKNGQIWGDEAIGHEDGTVKVWLNVPRPDALSEKHRTEWVCQTFERVRALCETEPEWRIADDRASRTRGETWQAGSGLYLFTHMFDKTSPVCAGKTGEPIPLYLLPVSQNVRESLFAWAGNYRTLDDLQIGCGPLEIHAYRQLAEVGSELSESGRSLCRTLEDATGQPSYYYLMRYWGREEGEDARRCPSCGGAWATPAPDDGKGLAWFDFRCKPCRLVSHLAVSFESRAKAAIGEWCSRREGARNE